MYVSTEATDEYIKDQLETEDSWVKAVKAMVKEFKKYKVKNIHSYSKKNHQYL